MILDCNEGVLVSIVFQRGRGREGKGAAFGIGFGFLFLEWGGGPYD